MEDSKLPEQFGALEEFFDWALATETERNNKRLNSEYSEIERFHGAVVARAEEAIEHLDQYELQALEGKELNLLNLLLALAEVTPAVAYYQGPFVAGGFDSNRMVPFDV